MSMQTSPAGINLLIQREGLKLVAYPDPATRCEPWTIGVGHTSAAGPPAVKPRMVITVAEATEILRRDLVQFERAVNELGPLSQNQFDACVSLAFNIGAGRFARSTVAKQITAKNFHAAADAFLQWANAGGKPILLRRRKAERLQFLGV